MQEWLTHVTVFMLPEKSNDTLNCFRSQIQPPIQIWPFVLHPLTKNTWETSTNMHLQRLTGLRREACVAYANQRALHLGLLNIPTFSDRQVWVNSADPDQTAPVCQLNFIYIL